MIRNVEIYLYIILSLLPFISITQLSNSTSRRKITLVKFLVSPRIFIKNAVS